MNRLSIYFTFTLFTTTLLVKAQQFDIKQQLQHHVDVLASDSLEGRGLGTLGKEKAQAYIVSQFKQAGIQPLGNDYLQPFTTRIKLAWVKGQNIVGVVKGSDPKLSDEYIVIGAHYDHLGYEMNGKEKTIYPGADDNASGVATIIELGRYFAQSPNLAKRSLLIVAFDAEESGLLGSQFFVADTLVKNSKIKAMFSLDMVGMMQKYEGLDLSGMETIKHGKDIANEFAGPNEIVLKTVNDKIVGNTDTYSFGAVGIPAVHVFTGTVSPYHKPEDKSDLLDYDGMLKIHVFMTDMLANLLGDENLAADDKFLAAYKTTVPDEGGDMVTVQKDKLIVTGLRLNYGVGYHNYNNDFFVAKSAFNFEGGFYSQINLNRVWTLQPEVLYSYNGSRHADGRFARHSVTTPLNLMLGTKSAKPNAARGFIFAGPYYQYNFSGKIDNDKLNFDTDYNRHEWGFSWGFTLHTDKVQLGWVFRNGLTSLSQTHLPKMTAHSSEFSLGFNFGK